MSNKKEDKTFKELFYFVVAIVAIGSGIILIMFFEILEVLPSKSRKKSITQQGP